MKRLLFILLVLCGAAWGQTSISCSTTGACGNVLTSDSSSSSNNNNIVYGIPMVVTSTGLTISDFKIKTGTGSGNISALLVCDSNTSGATVGNSSPCPTNNVVCSASTTFSASTTMTISLSSCPVLSTSARYWIFLNVSASTEVYVVTSGLNTGGGAAIAAWIQTSHTCCTAPSSITGLLSSTSETPELQATIIAAVNTTQTHFRSRNDDGSETTATWYAAEDTNFTAPLSTNLRLRMQVDTDGAIGSQQYQLEWKKSTDSAYRAVAVAPSQVVYTICASGCTSTTNFVAPNDVFSAVVECYGGGGAGARAAANSTPGGGGKGGSYAKVNAMPLTPGTTYTPTLGAGGVSATPTNGGATDFIGDSSTHCTAAGGVTPAISSLTGATTVNGTSVGDVINAGGNGANGSGTNAGGGGEAGGSAGAGNPGSGSTGGSGAGDGGDGGAGRTASNGVGTAGTAPGGGGGGALRVSTTSNNGGAGAAGMVRITYTATPAIQLSASANIAAGGATATTAQLSVPNAHSFTAGEISDDTNPVPAITIGSANYSEFEWSLQAFSPAVNGSIYTFRVTMNGVVLTTYSVTPQWTIGTGGLVSVTPRLTLMGVGP